MPTAHLRDLLDLVLGRACLACHRPGPVLCPACCADAARASIVGHLDGRPVAACGDYDGLLREMVLAYKERGTRAMAPALGRLLAASVVTAHRTVALHAQPMRTPTLVVPIPGHPRPARGFAALQDVAQHARPHLAANGLTVLPLLTITHEHSPVKGLGRDARQRQVHGTMSAIAHAPARVIIVDDVLTTGATVREAIRAMTVAGHRVVALAVIARATGPTRDRPARPPGSARATFRPPAGR